MPALLLHLTALERLALRPDGLPPEMGRALVRDIEYARLGAALPELPLQDGFRSAVRSLWLRRPVQNPWYERFHSPESALFGVKMAELVAMGALVGPDAGRAFVGGYFAHQCLHRRLSSLATELAPGAQRKGETLAQTHRRIEWAHALYYVREVYGAALVGSPQLIERLRLQKRVGPPRGMGGGLYELVRVSAHETLRDAPSRHEVNRWLRGLYVHTRLLATPLGTRVARITANAEDYRQLYRGPSVDVAEQVQQGLDDVCTVLHEVEGYMNRGVFTPRARRKLLEVLASICGGGTASGESGSCGSGSWSTEPHAPTSGEGDDGRPPEARAASSDR